MKIAVLANDDQWEEIQKSCDCSNMLRINDLANSPGFIDVYIILNNFTPVTLGNIDKPVFINSVTQTLSELKTPANVVRINGWNSFLSAKKWEVAGDITHEMKNVIASLGKQMIVVKDEIGFVSPRIIAMIINEAYFALGENISTKNEIDISMRSGTNYPYGPFEWAIIIGLNNIYKLLEKLASTSKRYIPAPLLKHEASL
ncbi:MAG: 3-hydroxyacyl-CoA dehydrogenase family protein [Ferruginibacter sp.]